MINIKVDVKDGVSPAIADLIDSLDDTADLNEVGGRAASEAAKDWHAEFSKAGGWRGNNYLGSGANTPGAFGQNISLGWNLFEARNDGATISNNPFYAFKVRGGTIIPKRTSHLTIPMVEEAVGRRAADYVAYSGNILFKIIGKKALFEALPSGGIRAVYALTKSVTQKPMPEAIPDEEVLGGAFLEGWRNALADRIESS